MVELKVPFVEKEHAKRLGAKWHAGKKVWFVPPGVATEPFAKWLPADFTHADVAATQASGPGTAQSLVDYLAFVQALVAQQVPPLQWISAEISELRQVRGHLYLTLVEHNAAGNLVARCSARVWQHDVGALLHKFKQGTQSDLTAGMKILVQIRAEFHPQFSFSLTIDDIDPAYTLGDMAAKLAQIRTQLSEAGLIGRNKALPKPVEFTQVAVISPAGAAGLGDFAREADLLSRHNLCQFHYFTAVFQGQQAQASLLDAVAQVEQLQQQTPIDVLVIIRGGGAVSDLAWLNEFKLAKAVCECAVPVLVGIGHERDYTIIDEVANTRLDTPSKVSHHILNTIVQRATGARNDYQTLLKVSHSIVAEQRARCQQLSANVQHAAATSLQWAQQQLASQQQGVKQTAVAAAAIASQQLRYAWQGIFEQATMKPQQGLDSLNHLKQFIQLKAQHHARELTQVLQGLIREVLSQGPDRVLARGFIWAKDPQGKTLTRAVQARQHAHFQLQFQDATVKVGRLDK